MSCYGCAKEFTLFNREHACAKCGFGFCGGCLKLRASLPGQGPKEQKVCAPCAKALQQPHKVVRQVVRNFFQLEYPVAGTKCS
jgi:hypothetical protein